MRVLLDTHVLLWFQALDKALPKKALEIIESTDNDCAVSIVSLWEIGIKHSPGELPLRMTLPEFFGTIRSADLRMLELRPDHILAAALLPQHHRDPFDRMLIAQATCEGSHLLTVDKHFELYDVPLVEI